MKASTRGSARDTEPVVHVALTAVRRTGRERSAADRNLLQEAMNENLHEDSVHIVLRGVLRRLLDCDQYRVGDRRGISGDSAADSKRAARHALLEQQIHLIQAGSLALRSHPLGD